MAEPARAISIINAFEAKHPASLARRVKYEVL